jgi:PKD repeat protein
VASDDVGTTLQSSSRLAMGQARQAPLNANLLAQPAYGMAPLTVDFSVILVGSPGSLVYQWDFGDGAVSSLPFATYLPHTYQHPGTYWCSLTLTSAGGRATTVFIAVIVRPHHG